MYDPWVGKIPWRRKWQPAPVFLPGESYGQEPGGLYSPWGCEESDIAERLSMITMSMKAIVFVYLFYLAASGLGSGAQDLCCVIQDRLLGAWIL